MKSTEITDQMVKDHGKIIKLLNDVEKVIDQERDLVSTMKVFDKFDWELEKHFFTEEKAIFTSYKPENVTTGYAMLPELIKEHNEILNNLRVMRRNIKKQKPFDFHSFKVILMKHKKFEEKEVYPKLDQELDKSEKKVIIQRINEVL
ncbi:MAG: hemerythrin domain-containing protein [Thermoplasmatales archaeon]|nr:MAG: hemerythrin domain-containing protein [Thermoplasmatales archaeon]